MKAPKAAMSMLPLIVSLVPAVAVEMTLTTARRHAQRVTRRKMKVGKQENDKDGLQAKQVGG